MLPSLPRRGAGDACPSLRLLVGKRHPAGWDAGDAQRAAPGGFLPTGAGEGIGNRNTPQPCEGWPWYKCIFTNSVCRCLPRFRRRLLLLLQTGDKLLAQIRGSTCFLKPGLESFLPLFWLFAYCDISCAKQKLKCSFAAV